MNGARKKALIVFEASPALGGGHAARCLALAACLSGQHAITLAVNTSAAGHLAPAYPDRLEPWPDGQPDELLPALERISPGTFDLAVVDHYRIDSGLEQRLRAWSKRVAVIDDLADRPHDADVLVDTAPGRTQASYGALTHARCRCLMGPDYALLRPEFRRARARPHAAPGDTTRVLVAMGATDPADATSRVLRDLALCTRRIDVTAVLSSAAPHLADVRSLVATSRLPVRLLTDVADMAALYLAHDIAIGAPATSALERCCVGLPSLLIETADNQHNLGHALAGSGACHLLGRIDALAPEAIARALDALADDPARLTDVARTGMLLVDGWGANRTAANLDADFSTDRGEPLAGRRLAASDAEAIFRWQTHPGTRQFSRNPAAPTWDEHIDWLERRRARTDAITEIVTLDGAPVAMARLDPAGVDQEVSIVVAPEHRGRGIGVAAIRYLDSFAEDNALVAWVHPDNAASIALFERCGYGTAPQRSIRHLAS